VTNVVKKRHVRRAIRRKRVASVADSGGTAAASGGRLIARATSGDPHHNKMNGNANQN
jgi:hypothetical protein